LEEIDIAPAFLVARFGEPLPGDGYRVTGRFSFRDEDGNVFTVYDYKSTSAFLADEEDALSPEEFWESQDEQELSIGGFGDYADGSAGPFVAWLMEQYAEWKTDNA